MIDWHRGSVVLYSPKEWCVQEFGPKGLMVCRLDPSWHAYIANGDIIEFIYGYGRDASVVATGVRLVLPCPSCGHEYRLVREDVAVARQAVFCAICAPPGGVVQYSCAPFRGREPVALTLCRVCQVNAVAGKVHEIDTLACAECR